MANCFIFKLSMRTLHTGMDGDENHKTWSNNGKAKRNTNENTCNVLEIL